MGARQINGNEQVTLLKPSGSGHAAGVAPDPGATSGITRFLREDATWSAPPSYSMSSFIEANSSGGVLTVNVANISSIRVPLTENITSVVFTGMMDGQIVRMLFKQPANYTVAFPLSTFRTAGEVSTVTNDTTGMQFFYDNPSSQWLAIASAVITSP